MNKERIKKNIATKDSRDNEDRPVIELLESLDPQKHYELLDVGSGLCRFVKKTHQLFPNITITCVEINEDLARIASAEGCEVFNVSFLDNKIASNRYDIVHCSHVIEHFGYPDIRIVLNELLRVTKNNGYLIIRSPLMWEHFYDDLDHVRPYPPDSIVNYLYNPQQQVVGKSNVDVIRIWYRTRPVEHQAIDRTSLVYGITPLRLLYNKHILPKRNKRLEKMWNKYRWPSTKPNGYVMILRCNK